MTSLTSLVLEGNSLTSLNNDTFRDTNYFLDLSANMITDISLGTFDDLAELVDLALPYNNIQTVDPRSVSKLMNLRVLDLTANQITFLEIDTFKSTQIDYLGLRYNELRCIPAGMFNPLSARPSIQIGCVLDRSKPMVIEKGGLTMNGKANVIKVV